MQGQADTGKWLQICGDGWNMPDAIVACRELNMGHPTTKVSSVSLTNSENFLGLLTNIFAEARFGSSN